MTDIGILTFHDTSNFGAILQAYATYKIVTDLGYSAEIIDYRCEHIAKREIPIERFHSEIGLKKNLKWVLRDYKNQKKYVSLRGFLRNLTKISDENYISSDFNSAANHYKGILVGSDMLWCTLYTESDYSYMLKGIEGCKKIAYGTSVGYIWDETAEDEIIGLLSSFDTISVREEDIAEYLSKHLNISVPTVCDPTMLIKAGEWMKYVSINIKHKYALIYMDDKDSNCEKSASSYALKNGLQLRRVSFRIGPFVNSEIIELYSISDFLSAIKNATIIFTASYHGVLFALYFHVPFVYYSKDTSRMTTLEDRIGIGYRDGNRFNVNNMKEIDWEEIDRRIEIYRNDSIGVLKKSLGVIDYE